jgi:hypothetical protein
MPMPNSAFNNPYLNSSTLTDEQKKQMMLQAQGQIPGMPSGLITQAAMNNAPNALPTLPGPPQSPASIAAAQQANAMEAPWANKMAPPPLGFGTRPGAPMSPGDIAAAGAPGAPPMTMPNVPGAPPPPRQTPGWMNALIGGMAGAGIGGQSGTGWGMGAGAGAGVGLGALANWLKQRREGSKQRRPFDEAEAAPALAKGGLIQARKPRPPKPLATLVRMAAGGAAKERQGYPRTTPPKKGSNPFKGIARGGGKATRGMNFKSS